MPRRGGAGGGERGIPLKSALIALLWPAALAAEPEAIVRHNIVLAPMVSVGLPETAQYVGSDRFVLSDPTLGPFDDCELYAFVEPGKTGALRRLYWVQFENYRPDHPDLHHSYHSPRHASLGGLDFYVDSWSSSAGSTAEPGSDAAHFDSLLTTHGYRLVPMRYVRLVHLFEAAKRKELMIIYGEAQPAKSDDVVRHTIAAVTIRPVAHPR